MLIRRSLAVKYPTVQYGNVDLYVSVELTADDLPDHIKQNPLQEQHAYMTQWADFVLQTEWLKTYEQAKAQLSATFYSIGGNDRGKR